MRRFARYGLVGIVNTLVHWAVFLGVHLGLGVLQAPSNLTAFIVAASVSYQLNAHYTFAVRPTGSRYMLFLFGMGGLSLLLGTLADWLQIRPWLTLVGFSGISLVVGYLYSRIVVFRNTKPGTCHQE